MNDLNDNVAIVNEYVEEISMSNIFEEDDAKAESFKNSYFLND